MMTTGEEDDFDFDFTEEETADEEIQDEVEAVSVDAEEPFEVDEAPPPLPGGQDSSRQERWGSRDRTLPNVSLPRPRSSPSPPPSSSRETLSSSRSPTDDPSRRLEQPSADKVSQEKKICTSNERIGKRMKKKEERIIPQNTSTRKQKDILNKFSNLLKKNKQETVGNIFSC